MVESMEQRAVSEVMLRNPKTLASDVTVAEARAALEKAHGRVVVLDGERLVGLVCLTEDGQRFCGRPGAMSA